MKTAILSLLITLALAAAGAYYVEQFQHFSTQSQQFQSKLQSQLDNEIKPALIKLETKFQDVKQDEHWKISEVIYLLRLSIEQLKVTQDVQTSLRLLQAADDQLKTIQDPTLTPVRDIINQERHALENVKLPDIEGLWLKIGLMINQVKDLPTRGVKTAQEESSLSQESKPEKEQEPKTAQNTADKQGITDKQNPNPVKNQNQNINVNSEKSIDAEKSNWKENLTKTFTKLNDLVKIQRHTKPIEPILPEYEQAMAKENLRLLLEQLRWTVLNRQTKLYQQLIQEIDQNLDAYFDNTDENVKNMRSSLQAISTLDLQPVLPEMGQALQLLQKR